MPDRPKVSVVTVNFNMREGLEKTIASVLAQSYDNLEYIVIDGGSTDGSAEVLAEFRDRLDYSISKPDRNLYDGMNTGVNAATGEWTVFMNSGDCFADQDVVADVFSDSHDNADLVYGHAISRYERQGFDRLIAAEPPSVLPRRMHCSHQALFSRSALLRATPFDLDLLIADYDFLLGCWVEGRRFKFVDRVIAVSTKGGRSDRQRLLTLKQQQAVLARRRLLTPWMKAVYPIVALSSRARLFLRESLPATITRKALASGAPPPRK
jgi:putative colanic acid biosynthesis glycosyltransferase